MAILVLGRRHPLPCAAEPKRDNGWGGLSGDGVIALPHIQRYPWRTLPCPWLLPLGLVPWLLKDCFWAPMSLPLPFLPFLPFLLAPPPWLCGRGAAHRVG